MAVLPWIPALALAVASCGGGDAAGPSGLTDAAGEVTLREGERGRLACDEPARRFGDVWEGSVVEAEFRLRSSGAEPAVVSTVRADCGCTPSELLRVRPDGTRVAYERGTPIPVGDELLLAVRFETGGKRGPQDKAIRVFANQPGGVVEVRMIATVRPRLVARPDSLTAAAMGEDERRELTFRVSGTAPEPYVLTWDPAGLPETAEVRLAPDGADADGRARSWDVTLALGPGMPRGTHNYPVRLRTDLVNPDGVVLGTDDAGELLREPFRLDVPLVVQVRGPVYVEPPALRFGIVEGDLFVSRSVRLAAHDPAHPLPEPRWRLEALKGDLPPPIAATARVTVRPVEGHAAYDLELALDGLSDEVDYAFQARLVLETGHPDLPLLEVPVSGIRRSGT